jgi:acetoin utilization protein AcuB
MSRSSLARLLNQPYSTVSRDIRISIADKLLTADLRGRLNLTPRGMELAFKWMQFREMLRHFFVRALGLEREAAEGEADAILFSLSEASLKSLLEHLQGFGASKGSVDISCDSCFFSSSSRIDGECLFRRAGCNSTRFQVKGENAMKEKTQIQEVMTLCPHSVGIDQPLTVAKQMIRRYQFRHLPVLKGGKIVGVVSDRDIKFAMGWSEADSENLRIKDVYTPDPYIASPDTPLEEVLNEMVEQQIGCALVGIGRSRLIGIFTTTDACRHLARLLSDAGEQAEGDEVVPVRRGRRRASARRRIGQGA